ncbi:MAG: CusA/CzcA family heavy metal efflux RND transporter, partial [bacterium]|nr:CusA/CzcA family heavy metal efflux RND transporter [bacterium]
KHVEDQVTYPLPVSMQGLAKVKNIRSMSQLGLSMVTVIFEESADLYFSRNRVLERLSTVSAQLPEGVNPVLGPDATSLGQIFMYTIESDQLSLTELRTLQDFTVQYALQSVPGVAEVASVGGYVKTYQVVVDPIKLDQYGVGLGMLVEAISSGNNNVSGKVVDVGGKEVAIQGIGFFSDPNEIKNIVLGSRSDGIALTVADVAEVRISGAFRRTILADGNEEKVGGVVVMRYGENPLKVIEAVKSKIRELEKVLPVGVTLQPFYDRTVLIEGTIHTLKKVLLEELVITMLVLAVFLWHFGSTLITACCLLVGVLITFISMYLFGIPSNIMSLGGVAIAIGTMVDAAIVVSENAYRKLMESPPATFSDRLRLVTEAAQEVGKPILFALLITILSFLPIFGLEGMEGKLFAPLAYTHTFALVGALVAGLFLAPLLSLYLLRGKLHSDENIFVVAFLQKLYRPVLLASLKFRKLTFLITAVVAIVGGLTIFGIGSEFMPPLDEGSIMYMPITVPDASEKQVQDLLLRSNQIIAGFPEVERVVGKAGRARTATDPAPLSMFETIVTLKPKEQWREGMTKGKLVGEINRAIKLDKLWNGFTQPIIGRVDMLATGVRAQVGVKIFGDDSARLEQLAIRAEELLSDVPGSSSVAAIRTMGLKYLNIDIREDLLARYGVSKADVLQAVAMGVGGMPITTTVEGRKRFDIEVRLKQSFRQNLEDIKSLPLQGNSGATVILSNVADIVLEDGPAELQSENGVLRSVVQMNVEGIDLVSFVEEAKAHLEENLELPEGYFLAWTGQYENHVRAVKKFSWMVPAVIVVIFLLLYLTYKDLQLVMLVMLTLPLGLVGGFISLYLTGYNFSVSVWVGFITLFGIAASMGVVKVIYLENAFRRRFNLSLVEDEGCGKPVLEPKPITKEGIQEAVFEGALIRLRPILMTGLTAIIGLIPMVTTTGIGSEVQKPLAVVVIGGLITVLLFAVIILPVVFTCLKERQISR